MCWFWLAGLLLLLSRFSVSDSVRPHGLQPTRLLHPWDFPGKNTGVSCHFLLQCMKVESESEVTQSCPTLSDSMDYSLPGSSIRGIFQARVLEWGAITFSGRPLGRPMFYSCTNYSKVAKCTTLEWNTWNLTLPLTPLRPPYLSTTQFLVYEMRMQLIT